MWKPVTGNLWSTKGKGSKRGKGEQGAAMRRPGKRRRNLDNLFQDKNSKRYLEMRHQVVISLYIIP